MIVVSILAAIVIVFLAGALATADGALLATHTAVEHARNADVIRGERERTHRALAMARVLAYLSAGAAIAQIVDLHSFTAGIRTLVGVGIATGVVALTESVGRAIAQAQPTSSLESLRHLVAVTVRVLAPLVALGSAIERGLHAVLPPPAADDEERETSAEQFREVVAAEAEISSAEEDLIHGVFEMGDTEVREIMVPRVDIVGLDATTPWSEVVDRVRSSEHARLPVFDDTIDEIVGILYAKDMLADVVAGRKEGDTEWKRLVRVATFIPTSKRIDAQLREFQASRTHIAIVTDEYGGTAGLVTIEDILEEIVGEIRDEYDVEEPDIQQEGTERYLVLGRVPLDELAERLDTDFEVEDVTTVGGLVYELFGRVPRAGEAVARGGYRIGVDRVRRRRIERVSFERMEKVTGGKDK